MAPWNSPSSPPGSTVAPGRHGATRGTSSSTAQASSIDAGTVNSFSSFMVWGLPELLRVQPVVADTRVDGQRRVHVGGLDHLARDDLGRLLHLLRRALEKQLVVDLEDHASREPGALERVAGT